MSFFENDDEIRIRDSAVANAKREIEQQVAQLDLWAKQSADAGDYSGAGSNQKAAVDLHCAVAIMENAVFPPLCQRANFYQGDGSCPHCEWNAWRARQSGVTPEGRIP